MPFNKSFDSDISVRIEVKANHRTSRSGRYGCITECFGGNHSNTQFTHQLHPLTLRIRISLFPQSYRLESPDASFRIELYQDITYIEYDILVLHNL